MNQPCERCGTRTKWMDACIGKVVTCYTCGHDFLLMEEAIPDQIKEKEVYRLVEAATSDFNAEKKDYPCTDDDSRSTRRESDERKTLRPLRRPFEKVYFALAIIIPLGVVVWFLLPDSFLPDPLATYASQLHAYRHTPPVDAAPTGMVVVLERIERCEPMVVTSDYLPRDRRARRLEEVHYLVVVEFSTLLAERPYTEIGPNGSPNVLLSLESCSVKVFDLVTKNVVASRVFSTSIPQTLPLGVFYTRIAVDRKHVENYVKNAIPK